MKQFKIFFHEDTVGVDYAPYEVESEANTWLSRHPDIQVLSFTTTMSNQRSSNSYLDTQFALTMLVETPEQNPQRTDELKAVTEEQQIIPQSKIADVFRAVMKQHNAPVQITDRDGGWFVSLGNSTVGYHCFDEKQLVQSCIDVYNMWLHDETGGDAA